MSDSLENQENSFDNLRETLIMAAIPHVAFTGWSMQTLTDAAQDAGIDPELAHILFPNVRVDLALGFHQWADQAFQSSINLEGMRVREKITHLVRRRLEVLEPHKEAVRTSIALFTIPIYAPQGMRAILETMDIIWNLAGDRAQDYNWYTKRMTLLGVYTSTLLYFLDDKSDNHEQTWRFLDRRIANVMEFEAFKTRMQKNELYSNLLFSPLRVLKHLKKPDLQAKDSPFNFPDDFPGHTSHRAYH